MATISLGESRDKFIWGPHICGLFSVRSMYFLLMNTLSVNRNIRWSLILPLKIKIFLWYLGRGVTLTKNNLAKRGWKGCLKCSFRNQNKSIQHMLFDC
jgi:hypothetical protein